MQHDPFAQFRNSSPEHKAETTPEGWLKISVPDSGSEPSLIAFQPTARQVLDIAYDNGWRVPHAHITSMYPGELYDLIIVAPPD